MDEPSLEINGNTVLILGDCSLESVEDKIVALGHTFQKRILGSQPDDGIEIEKALKQLNSSGKLVAVLLFLSKKALFKLSASDYLHF